MNNMAPYQNNIKIPVKEITNASMRDYLIEWELMKKIIVSPEVNKVDRLLHETRKRALQQNKAKI